MTKNGEELQLGDFGLSQIQAYTAKVTRTLNAHGFPAYLAPELLKFPEIDTNGKYVYKYDHKVDVWSCGAILYELFHLAMMWFKLPENKNPPGELVLYWTRERVLKNQHEKFASDCPEVIRHLIRQCCNQSAQRRPEASELLKQATGIKEAIQARIDAVLNMKEKRLAIIFSLQS